MNTTPSIPIIDSHQHLWDLAKFHVPWMTDGSPLKRCFVMDDYVRAVDGMNVVKSVYMEIDLDAAQQAAEAEYVCDICRRGGSPMVAAVIGGEPASPGFDDYLKRFKGESGIRGLRSLLHRKTTPPGTCTKPEYIRGVQKLGEIGWSFSIGIRPADLGDVIKLVDACPQTQFILDHCGTASARWAVDAPARLQWQRDIAELARRKNLYCKISGIVATTKHGDWTPADLAPFVKHCIGEFGWDRSIFGGDWPVCTLGAPLRQWIEALKEIVKDATADQQRQLFHDNAVKFYRL